MKEDVWWMRLSVGLLLFLGAYLIWLISLGTSPASSLYPFIASAGILIILGIGITEIKTKTGRKGRSHLPYVMVVSIVVYIFGATLPVLNPINVGSVTIYPIQVGTFLMVIAFALILGYYAWIRYKLT